MAARTPSPGQGRREFLSRVGGTAAAAAALTGALPAPVVAEGGRDDGGHSSSDEVIQWNQVMTSALVATAQSPQNSVRIGAIVQGAVLDAVNGIERRYTPYLVNDPGPRGASARAAAVQAAYTALKALLPAQALGLERQR